MQVIKARRGRLILPPATAKAIGPEAEFAVVAVGDTLILKKVTPLRLSEIARRAAKDRAMTLRQISQEVHRQRRSRHARGD